MSYSSSSRLRRFATRPIPVKAARAPSSVVSLDDSVPVFGNSFCDLPADSDGVSEDNVSTVGDILVDAD